MRSSLDKIGSIGGHVLFYMARLVPHQIRASLVSDKKLHRRTNKNEVRTSIGINRFAIAVMREIRIDILNHRAKSLRKFEEQEFDYVVTVCNDEEDICPFSAKEKDRWQSFVATSKTIG